MHQKKIFDFFFFFFFFGQPAELTAFFVRQIFLHLPELIWIWNILRRQQATPKILSEWWFFRADVPAPAQAPAGWLCWCWDVLLPWVVQKSLGQEKNTYMFTASGCFNSLLVKEKLTGLLYQWEFLSYMNKKNPFDSFWQKAHPLLCIFRL